jgi:hypothetical protein
MKTVLEVSASGRSSGYAEAQSVDSTINSRVLGREIWLADACTPIPNCRPAEIFLSVWSALEAPASTVIHTDVISAGVHLGSPSDAVPEMLAEWVEIFDQRLLRERTLEFAPFAPSGLVVPNSEVRRHRLEKIRNVAEILRPHIGDVGYERVRVSDGAFCFKIPMNETQEILKDGASLGEFVCPGCSYQRKVAMVHALRYVSGELLVTDARSVGRVKCPASRVLLRKLKEGSYTVEELIRIIGLRPSGKLFYAVSRSNGTASRGLCMRDYSDPRGTVSAAVKLWYLSIWITTRLYIVDESGKDLQLDRFLEALYRNPEIFASVMRDYSFLSTGKEISLITHTGGA